MGRTCSVAQSCPTSCDPMDYSSPGSSVHGVFQARILEWVSTSFPKIQFPTMDQTTRQGSESSTWSPKWRLGSQTTNQEELHEVLN